MYSHQSWVTVAAPGADPEGETGTSITLLAASQDQKKCPFFLPKQVNAVVLGCFVLLRCGFGCDCGWCLFVSVVFMLRLRFLLVVVVFCCFLLFFVVFLLFWMWSRLFCSSGPLNLPISTPVCLLMFMLFAFVCVLFDFVWYCLILLVLLFVFSDFAVVCYHS